MRNKIIVGNWKMFKTNTEAIKFAESVDKKINVKQNVITGIAVPSIMLHDLKKISKNLTIVAQNCYFEKEGAFTGEISIPMLQDIGINYAIIGHSERREIFKENDELINAKIKALVKAKMNPILCCGESLSIYEAGTTMDFIKNQLYKNLHDVSAEQVKLITIAYEPIWAIGTGKVATPQIAQDVCHQIRNYIKELYDESTAEQIMIQYGGSVNPSNVEEILIQPDIDGVLVGGASLSEESYLGLIKYNEHKN